MFVFLIAPLIWFAILALVLFAWVKGGQAERLGGAAVVASALVAFLIHRLLPDGIQPVALLADEAALAAAFLVLAMRFVSPWIGVAMILQAVQFSLHAFYLVVERPHDTLYKAVNNVNTIGVLLCILFGTMAVMRKRARAAK